MRVRDDPPPPRAGKNPPLPIAAVPVVNLYRPEKFLCSPTTIVFEEKIPAPGLTAAGSLVIAKIKDVVVIQPSMVARIVIKIANIRAIRRDGVGLEELILRIFDEGDEARAGWVPPLAEDVTMTRRGD